VAGGMQFANGEDIGTISHLSTVDLHRAGNRGNFPRFFTRGSAPRPTLDFDDCSNGFGTARSIPGTGGHPRASGAPRRDADDGYGTAGTGTGAASFRARPRPGSKGRGTARGSWRRRHLLLPLERTRETAEPTAASTGRDVNQDAGLIECDFGEWTGAALAELAVLPEWQTVQQSPSTFRFPDGESFAEMQERMVGALEVLRSAHAGGVVVCFSHADPIKAAVAHAFGTQLDHFQRIVISPGSVSAISFVEGQDPAVLMVNSTSEPLSGLRAS